MRITIVFKNRKKFLYKRVVSLEDRVLSWVIRTSMKKTEVLKSQVESIHIGDSMRDGKPVESGSDFVFEAV